MNETDEEAGDQESLENDSPTRVLTVRDRFNEAYCLEWWAADYGWSVWLYNKSGFKIGYAHTQIRKDILFLADLHIEDGVPTIRSGMRKLIESIGWARPQLINYRHRGLAKLVLGHLESLAKERGYREITGGIVETDIAKWPGLPDWYRRRGYLVFEKPYDCIDIGKLAIQKKLIASA